jgi:hypothetical protein
MKKILLSFMLIGALVSFNKLQAQCALSNVNVSLNSAVTNGNGTCTINFDLSFDIENNGGNKYIWINLWKSTDYALITPSPYHKNGNLADAPKLDQLDGAGNTNDPIAVIGLNNDALPFSYLTSYPADPGNITPLSSATAPTNVNGHIELKNLQVTIPGACAGLVIQGDVWSSQANSSNAKIHCLSAGISFYGDPTISGFMNCGADTKQFSLSVQTVSTSDLTVNYKVYADKGTIGTYDDGTDVLIYTSPSPIVVNSLTTHTLSNQGYSSAYKNDPLIVVLNVLTPFGKTITGVIPFAECIPLPVHFKSFNAIRSNSSVVSVSWTTAMEQNSKGFYVQKNVNGEWKTVAYVESQAVNGNSSSDLNYSYTDANTEKGITQYRILQVDLDGKSKYSDIRAIRGDGNLAKVVVYPNPSTDGKVNIVFEDNSSLRDIIVNDMQGKVIRSFRGVSNNILVIEKLTTGFYTIKVSNRTTNASSVHKVVIK